MLRVFELVAEAKSEETFIALCLLSVTGASLLTQRLGFSDTLGAFVAGVLLSGVPSPALSCVAACFLWPALLQPWAHLWRACCCGERLLAWGRSASSARRSSCP